MSLPTIRRASPRFGTAALLTTITALALSIVPRYQAEAQSGNVVDLALGSGFQDNFGGLQKRGRASIAADFDLDGRIDFFLGNPGDPSFVLRNVDDGNGRFHFVVAQVLAAGPFPWGAVSGDFDNDGDYDLFIATGGPEGAGFNRMFLNRWLETGTLTFEDVTAAAGISGPIPDGGTNPVPTSSGGAVTRDYDRDGDTDIFVNGNIRPDPPNELTGRNTLWRNNDDGTFTDVTEEVGLHTSLRRSRHSVFLDFDNDGDSDLYENNLMGANVMWRNLLVETGTATFEEVTGTLSRPPLENMAYPYNSFAAAVADFNNDGWEDIVNLVREATDQDISGPYGVGHALFMNVQGTGFTNVAAASGLNNRYDSDYYAMGCQVGDLNLDGVADVFVGDGEPLTGRPNSLFISNSGVNATPRFADLTHLINFSAPETPQAPPDYYPTFPYRTHGSNIVDVDNDGTLELAVSNGGPAVQPDTVREPNRLFKFNSTTPPVFLKVHPVGDALNVSMDAIGTRLALTVSSGGGTPYTLHRTLLGGRCFSAQNGFDIVFGLNGADAIHDLTITWPDGHVDVMTENLVLNTSMVVNR